MLSILTGEDERVEGVSIGLVGDGGLVLHLRRGQLIAQGRHRAARVTQLKSSPMLMYPHKTPKEFFFIVI